MTDRYSSLSPADLQTILNHPSPAANFDRAMLAVFYRQFSLPQLVCLSDAQLGLSSSDLKNINQRLYHLLNQTHGK